MRSQYDANLKKIEEMYNLKLQNMTASFQDKEKYLDIKVNETILELLEQSTNISGTRNFCNCKTNQLIMKMENATREQLEQGYATLVASLQNLTDAYTDLLQKYREVKEELKNTTTESGMNTTWMNEVHKTRDNLTDINQRLTNAERNCSFQMTIDELSANISRHDKDLANNIAAVSNNATELSNIMSVISTIIRNMTLNRSTVAQLRQKIGYQSAFAVDTPAATSTKGTISFSHEISNIGGHFNKTTGKYTCPYDGIYVFILHMHKHYTEPFAYCWVRVNGIRVLYADSDPQTRSGFDEASKSGPFHLRQRDVVDIGGCTDMKTISPLTSFTGFLLHAD